MLDDIMDASKELVVILHGIGQTSWNMRGMERALRDGGFRTLNISYPSCRMQISELAEFVAGRLHADPAYQHAIKIHFVTHSMGGLVAQRYLEKYQTSIAGEKKGRLVMVAPPNQGSEVADFLQGFRLYQWIYGPAGQELTTALRRNSTSSVQLEFGIIAGNCGWPYPVAGFLFPTSHDGRVAVEKTRLDGMKSHITVPCTHGFISWNKNVHRQTTHFLKNGEFHA